MLLTVLVVLDVLRSDRCLRPRGYEVVAINDLTAPSMLADLLKYDTAQGGFCGVIGENLHTVEADDEAGTITVDGQTLKIYKEADASKLPGARIGVDVVLECTGFLYV